MKQNVWIQSKIQFNMHDILQNVWIQSKIQFNMHDILQNVPDS